MTSQHRGRLAANRRQVLGEGGKTERDERKAQRPNTGDISRGR